MKISALLVGAILGCAQTVAAQTTPMCSYTVVNSYPHDPAAFTQGLLYESGFLYESTGRTSISTLRKVELETGVVVLQHDLGGLYFGEGLTLFGDRLIQLTWLSHTGFEYDVATFAEIDTFSYEINAWGLTDDGRHLIVSNGSSSLFLWDPQTYEEIGQLDVFDAAGPVSLINEMEYIYGEILANLYESDLIARIDASTGEIVAYIDLSGLLDPKPPEAGVLNGIAYDFDNGRLFVTGKDWPTLFEIEIVGCPGFPIFVDGFESGSMGEWSNVID